MKRSLSIALCCASLFISAHAFAQTDCKGSNQQTGYVGPSATMTVKQALSLSDDTPVTLRGQITQSLGGEKYLFRDETGSVQLDIDHKVFTRSGAQVSASDTVEISGEIDKDFKKTEIEVKSIKKL